MTISSTGMLLTSLRLARRKARLTDDATSGKTSRCLS
jgi:hypothetical protein